MKFLAIIHRRLREGKTFDDYRTAWFHATGFGAPTTMYTVVNAFDPRDLISVGVIDCGDGELEETRSKMEAMLATDVKERSASPLDDIVEEEIVRQFGLVIAEDDFSAPGTLEYVPPSVDGRPSDYAELVEMSARIARSITEAAARRDELTDERKKRREG